AYAVLLAVYALPMFYHSLTIYFDPFNQTRYATNVTQSLNPLLNLLALAPYIYLVIRGFQTHALEPQLRKFSLTWIVVALILAYSPVPYSQRYFVGLIIPTGFMAFYGFADLWRWLKQKLGSLKLVELLVKGCVLFVLFSGSLVTLVIVVLVPVYRTKQIPKSFAEVVSYLEAAPKATVLAPSELSLFLTGRAGQKSYVAHWSETLYFPQKYFYTNDLYEGKFPPQIVDQFLAKQNLTYVLVPKTSPILPSNYQVIFENSDYYLFKVKE
ncbi:MAG: hypothetical protein V1821_02165, partial [bacterium]